MKLFQQRNDRPDIPKDAPKKKGAAKVFSTLWREFWGLIKLNILFILTCIPVVTIPASITAMSRITCTMVRDENYFLWVDYWKAFKRDFWKSFFGGLVFAALLAAFGVSVWFYMMLYGNSKLFIALAGTAVCLVLAVLMAGFYYFPMLSMVDLPFKALIMNSFVVAFAGFKRTLLALAAFAAFFVLGIGLYPYSVIYIVFIMFSLSSLMIALAVYPVIDDRVMEHADEPPEEKKDTLPEENSSELRSASQFVWQDEEETDK